MTWIRRPRPLPGYYRREHPAPDNPGQFGRDCAAGVQDFQDGGDWDDGEPGASEWGGIAGDRAGNNGDINRDYRDAVDGEPNPENDNRSGND